MTVETAQEIQQDIARKREDLAASIDALRLTVRSRFDWREQLRTHPRAVLLATLALSFMLTSSVMAGIRRRRERRLLAELARRGERAWYR